MAGPRLPVAYGRGLYQFVGSRSRKELQREPRWVIQEFLTPANATLVMPLMLLEMYVIVKMESEEVKVDRGLLDEYSHIEISI